MACGTDGIRLQTDTHFGKEERTRGYIIKTPGVTNPLILPSHGGIYVAEGRLLLGSDWLIVVHEPCLFFCLHTSPHIVTVRRILLSSRPSGFGVALSPYHAIFVISRFISTACMVSCIP